MKMKCILSTTATGDVKSKIVNKEMATISLDCYISPKQFAEIVEKFEGKVFEV